MEQFKCTCVCKILFREYSRGEMDIVQAQSLILRLDMSYKDVQEEYTYA
jgi:hypothetical protein